MACVAGQIKELERQLSQAKNRINELEGTKAVEWQ